MLHVSSTIRQCYLKIPVIHNNYPVKTNTMTPPTKLIDFLNKLY